MIENQSRAYFLTRQADIIPPASLGTFTTIIGAGAIGSQAAMCLSKMGFYNLFIYDMDVVSEENMNCQWYGPADIGSYKVIALNRNIKALTGLNVDISTDKVDGDLDEVPEVIICAVDSMESRKEIFQSNRNSGARWFIDPRMGAEEGALYCVDLKDDKSISRYEKTLYSDEEAVQEACTAKATMYCAMMLSGHVAKAVKDISIGEKPSHSIHWNIREDAYLSYGRNQ